jgi:thiamine transporter
VFFSSQTPFVFNKYKEVSIMKQKSSIYVLTESAIMVALSCALFAVSEFIPWPNWLQGGGITLFGQVPIIVLSYRRGLKAGIPAALVLAIFELIMGLSNFAYVKGFGSYLIVALFDYIIAFGVLGLGGVFRNLKGNDKIKIAAGAALACLLRFICHFISGVTVWRDYTSDLKASIIYSITYNGGYMLPETIITLIGVLAVAIILPKELTKFMNKENK